MNLEEAKNPYTERDWHSIEIYLFSNGQEYSPPRKYHLGEDELNWWEATLNQLAKSHYGIQYPQIYLYTIDGQLVEGPLELRDGQAYVAVQPPEEFIDAGYQKYLLKASRSWEKRQARKKTGCDENCTGIKNIDRLDSIEPLMPATRQPDWRSQGGNFVTTVRPKPENAIYYPDDYGNVLKKSGTPNCHPEPNKLSESEPYYTRPSKQNSGTDLRRNNENSSKTGYQKPSSSMPRNTNAVQGTDHHNEPDNDEPWTNKDAPKLKTDETTTNRSLDGGFQVPAERILGSIDRGFQQRNDGSKPLNDHEMDESMALSMYTHDPSLTRQPRTNDYGSKTNQQRARSYDDGSRDLGNVASKDRPISEENGKGKIKMDKNGRTPEENGPMSTDLRNKSFDQENIPDNQQSVPGAENLRDNENYPESQREQTPEKNDSKTKANEFIRKTIDSRERSAEARNKENERDDNVMRQISGYSNGEYKNGRRLSALRSNSIEYKDQPNKQGSESEYIRKSSQQNSRNGMNGNKIAEPRSSVNENINEYNKNERKMSELKNNDTEYKDQPNERRGSENDYLRKSSQQKSRNGSNVEKPKSTDNENVNEYNRPENNNQRGMRELNSNDIKFNGRPSEQKDSENEYIRKSSQQKSRNGMNGSKIEESRNSINKNINEFNNNERRMSQQQPRDEINETKVAEPRSRDNENLIEYNYERRTSELKHDGLDHKGPLPEHSASQNEYVRKSSQQKPRNGINGSKVVEPRTSVIENLSEENDAYDNYERRTSEFKRDGLDHKGHLREPKSSENEYLRKLSQQKSRNGTNGSNVGGPRSTYNENVSENNNTNNARRMSDPKRNEYIRKLSQQKPTDGMNGSKVEKLRSSVNENTSEYKNEYDNPKNKNERRISEQNSGIEYKGQPSEQKSSEHGNISEYKSEYNNPKNKNEQRISERQNSGIVYKTQLSEQRVRGNGYTRKLSQQKPRDGINGGKLGEPRSSVHEKTASINESRLKDPERNNRVSIQRMRESELGSKFGENQSRGGDLRIRGGSGQDTERRSSILKTLDRRNKPLTAGTRTNVKDKTSPRPGLTVSPMQADESKTPFGDTDVNDRISKPNSIINNSDRNTFEPTVRLDNEGDNKAAEASHVTETQQNTRKSSLSTENSLKRYPIAQKTQNPPFDKPNQSEEILVTKDKTDAPDFVSNELDEQNSIPKYPIKHMTLPVTPSPTIEFGLMNMKKASTSITTVISKKGLTTDSIPIENIIGDKEIIIVSKNLFRYPESEITSVRLDSVKQVIDDIQDAPTKAKTELVSIQQSVTSTPVNEGVQTYAEVCDAAEQHGHGVVAYNTTQMQWVLTNLRDNMVTTNDNENFISILNKGDVVNLKLNIEVINGETSLISSQNTTRKSRSLTNIATTEKGSQITIDDDLYVPSKSLQSILNEEACNGSGFEGHPKVVVVQCACCERQNIPPQSDLPKCCDSKKYFVLLASTPQHLEDKCNCDTPHQAPASTQSGIPVKKTYSDMDLETAIPHKKDTEMFIAINSTSQTDDTKSECLVTKHKVSITEDILKGTFKKESMSQVSMTTQTTCNAPNSTCHKLYSAISVQNGNAAASEPALEPQVGLKIYRGVLKQCPQGCPQTLSQVESQNCPQEQSQNCPQDQSQNCPQNCLPKQNRLPENVQQVQLICCPHTCPKIQPQSCPQACQQAQSQGGPQNQTQSQTEQQGEPESTETSPQAQLQENSQGCPAVQSQAPTGVPLQTCCPAGAPTCPQMQAQEDSQPKSCATTYPQIQSQGCQKVSATKIENPQSNSQVGPSEQSAKVCLQVQGPTGAVTVQVPSQSCIQIRQETSHTHSQTQWCNVMLEARLHEDGRYSLHLPPLHVLKQYSF